MATSLLSLAPAPNSPLPRLTTKRPTSPSSFATRFSSIVAVPGVLSSRSGDSRSRGRQVLVRAGPPSTNSLILAFLLPLSLLGGTIFTAARIADQLDERYLEEVAMNKATMEENEAAGEEGGGGEGEEEGKDVEKMVEVAAPRARSRPRRQV